MSKINVYKTETLTSRSHLPLARGRGDSPTLPLYGRWDETNRRWTWAFFPSSFVASVPEENSSFYAELELAGSPSDRTVNSRSVRRRGTRAQHKGDLWFLKPGWSSSLTRHQRTCFCHLRWKNNQKKYNLFFKTSAFFISSLHFETTFSSYHQRRGVSRNKKAIGQCAYLSDSYTSARSNSLKVNEGISCYEKHLLWQSR